MTFLNLGEVMKRLKNITLGFYLTYAFFIPFRAFCEEPASILFLIGSKEGYKVWKIKSSGEAHVIKTIAKNGEWGTLNGTDNPIYSPSFEKLAFIKDANLWISDEKSGKNWQANSDGFTGDKIYCPIFTFTDGWSVDGNKIAYYILSNHDEGEDWDG